MDVAIRTAIKNSNLMKVKDYKLAENFSFHRKAYRALARSE